MVALRCQLNGAGGPNEQVVVFQSSGSLLAGAQKIVRAGSRRGGTRDQGPLERNARLECSPKSGVLRSTSRLRQSSPCVLRLSVRSLDFLSDGRAKSQSLHSLVARVCTTCRAMDAGRGILIRARERCNGARDRLIDNRRGWPVNSISVYT
jgi:hypothetical protein